MKIYIIKALLASCLFIMFSSCGNEYKFEPTPSTAITGITTFTPEGVKKEHSAKPDADGNIYLSIEGSVKMDMTKISMSINIANNSRVESETPLGEYMDFTKPISFDVVASDGSRKMYTVHATLFATKLGVKELWYKLGSEFGFSDHNNRSVGISGDYFVVHDRNAKGAYKYYSLESGAYAGVLDNTNADDIDALHMVTDDAGNIVNCSFAPSNGSLVKMYWWNGVNAAPQTLVEWTSTMTTALGRKLYVKGDITKLAYVYLTEQDTGKFLRWEVKNGVVTSQEPEITQISHPLAKGWGTNGRVIPTDLSPNSNYFTNTSREVRVTYMDGFVNTSIFNSEMMDPAWLANGGHALDYIDLKGAKFLFVMEQNANNWMPSIFKVYDMIKSPVSINATSDLVHTRKREYYDRDTSLATNGNVVGEVRARVEPDGISATVVFLCTNMGVAVWKVNLE